MAIVRPTARGGRRRHGRAGAELKKRYWLDQLEPWFPNGPEDPGVSLVTFETTSARRRTRDGDGEADLA